MRDLSNKSLLFSGIILLAVLPTLWPTGSNPQGAPIVVDSTMDTIANDGACTLREAIINTNNDDQSGSTDCPAGTGDDTIALKGFYQLTIEGLYENTALTGDLDITDNLTIQGLDAGATIDGNSIDRVFHVYEGVVVTFSGVTIQNGNAPYIEESQGPDEHGGGGGIAISGGTIVLRKSTLTANRASDGGGGIWNVGGTLQVSNTTISGNYTGDGSGGGIFNYEGTVVLKNATVFANRAEFDGAGIFTWGDGRIEVVNTIVAGNTTGEGSADCAGNIVSLGHNIIGSATGCEYRNANGDLVGANNSLVDPHLGPLQDNGGHTLTHALLPGSPAIDRGNNESCPATDQRGVSRPQGTTCDIGALEASPYTLCIERVWTEDGDGNDKTTFISDVPFGTRHS